jgi:hypothetical protein
MCAMAGCFSNYGAKYGLGDPMGHIFAFCRSCMISLIAPLCREKQQQKGLEACCGTKNICDKAGTCLYRNVCLT